MGNWGTRVKVVFDNPVYVNDAIPSDFHLVEAVYGTMLYATAVQQGVNSNEILLDFDDFNIRWTPLSLNYTGTKMTNIDPSLGAVYEVQPVEPFSLVVATQNLARPFDGVSEYLSATFTVTGTVEKSFNGQLYENEYLQATFTVTGTHVAPDFLEGYNKEYLQATFTATGTLCDINGIPI